MLLKRGHVLVSSRPHDAKSPSNAFSDSLTVEILNPKSALFYFAFLPQFTSPDAPAGVWVQILVLGAIANVMFSMTDVVCILAAHFVAAKATATNIAGDVGRKIGGCVLIGMGAKIAIESR